MRLNKRREQVKSLLLQGLRNQDIAKVMGITEKTVKDHLWREFKLVGVKTRTEYLIRNHNDKVSKNLGKRIADIITGGLDGPGQLTRPRY